RGADGAGAPAGRRPCAGTGRGVGRMADWMVGVDAGGTFTDLIAVEPARGEVRFAKVASVPSDPSQAVMNALEAVFGQGIAPGEVAFFAHGTTVATNAILEGKGATTGLLITRG